MKKAKPVVDNLRPEYRLEDLGTGVRGKYFSAYQKDAGSTLKIRESECPMTPDASSPAALTRESILDLLRDSYPHLSEQFGVQRIGLFGSFARKTAVETSDVDLVVSFKRPIGLKFVDLVEHLESLLGRKVDVLTPAGLQGIRLPEVARRIEESIIYV